MRLHSAQFERRLRHGVKQAVRRSRELRREARAARRRKHYSINLLLRLLQENAQIAFEGFDGMGKARTTENNLPVDSTTTIAAGTDFDGDYADSNALATAMASSATVRTCVAAAEHSGAECRGREVAQLLFSPRLHSNSNDKCGDH